MNNNIVYALYDDDDILLSSVKMMKEKDYQEGVQAFLGKRNPK